MRTEITSVKQLSSRAAQTARDLTVESGYEFAVAITEIGVTNMLLARVTETLEVPRRLRGSG